jgi:hypothetical protein
VNNNYEPLHSRVNLVNLVLLVHQDLLVLKVFLDMTGGKGYLENQAQLVKKGLKDPWGLLDLPELLVWLDLRLVPTDLILDNLLTIIHALLFVNVHHVNGITYREQKEIMG